ncbi:hypothetical protein D3C87_1588170 [compost metagenome]
MTLYDELTQWVEGKVQVEGYGLAKGSRTTRVTHPTSSSFSTRQMLVTSHLSQELQSHLVGVINVVDVAIF